MNKILMFAMSLLLSSGAIACTYDQECGGQEICCRLSYCSDPLYCPGFNESAEEDLFLPLQLVAPVKLNETCAQIEGIGSNV